MSNNNKVTILEYFNDTYLFELKDCEIINIKYNEENKEYEIILDKTIIHPQGGGQPSDVGILEKGDAKFIVKKALKNEIEQIIHYGYYENIEQQFETYDKVNIQIDKELRLKHARLHSAGHLLDLAMDKLDLNFKPSKGMHFPNKSFVEYVGKIHADKRIEYINKLNDIIQQLIQDNINVTKIMTSYDELKLYLKDIPSYLKPNVNKLRLIQFGEYVPCPCGGTHVKNSSELMGLKITKIEKKKKNIRILYTIE